MKPDKKQILKTVLEVLAEMKEMYELEIEEFSSNTKLVQDVGFSSIDIMHLLASIDMRYQRKFPFEELVVKNGNYVSDLSVQELVDFIAVKFDIDVPVEDLKNQ